MAPLKKRVPSEARPLRRSKRHMVTSEVDYENATVEEPLNLVDKRISETIIDDTMPEEEKASNSHLGEMENSSSFSPESFSVSLTIDELLSNTSATLISKKVEENKVIFDKLLKAKTTNHYNKIFMSSFKGSSIIPKNVITDLKERITKSPSNFLPLESFEYLLENNYITDSSSSPCFILIEALISANHSSVDLIRWSKMIKGLCPSSIIILLKHFISTYKAHQSGQTLPSSEILDILSLPFHSYDMKTEIRNSLRGDEMLILFDCILAIAKYYSHTHSATITNIPSLESTLKWIEVVVDAKRDNILLEISKDDSAITEKLEKVKEFLSTYTKTTETMLEIRGKSSMLCNLSDKNTRTINGTSSSSTTASKKKEEKIEKTIISTITIPAF